MQAISQNVSSTLWQSKSRSRKKLLRRFRSRRVMRSDATGEIPALQERRCSCRLQPTNSAGRASIKEEPDAYLNEFRLVIDRVSFRHGRYAKHQPHVSHFPVDSVFS